jgi:hypothetical protein
MTYCSQSLLSTRPYLSHVADSSVPTASPLSKESVNHTLKQPLLGTHRLKQARPPVGNSIRDTYEQPGIRRFKQMSIVLSHGKRPATYRSSLRLPVLCGKPWFYARCNHEPGNVLSCSVGSTLFTMRACLKCSAVTPLTGFEKASEEALVEGIRRSSMRTPRFALIIRANNSLSAFRLPITSFFSA